MKNKIVIVTGASDGIGKETARAMAQMGATLLMHGRNPEKTRKACDEIKSSTGNPNVDYITADFLSLKSVHDFAEKVIARYPRVDILINNAGAQFTNQREETEEGNEKTMTINLFAPVLLTELLLPSLKRSASARVVTVASEAHRMGGKPDLNDIQLKQRYSMARAYGLSKLYVIWAMQYLAKKLRRSGVNNVNIYIVHPASAMSQLGRESTKNWKTRLIYWLWRPMMKTTAEGASSSIYAASSPQVEGVTGRYYGLKGEQKPSQKYYSPENEKSVWDYCQNIIKPYL